jgi:hypothetical protein
MQARNDAPVSNRQSQSEAGFAPQFAAARSGCKADLTSVPIAKLNPRKFAPA